MTSQKKCDRIDQKFRALSLSNQKNFLCHLYSFSPDTKKIFDLWLDQDEEKVLEEFLLLTKKETFNRINKYRKLRVAQINDILKRAKKVPLSDMAMIKLYDEAWRGVLAFCTSSFYTPSRYYQSGIKYFSLYIDSLESIAEVAEKKEREEKAYADFLLYAKEEARRYTFSLLDFYELKKGGISSS
jgi:hypothetical protein